MDVTRSFRIALSLLHEELKAKIIGIAETRKLTVGSIKFEILCNAEYSKFDYNVSELFNIPLSVVYNLRMEDFNV